MSKLYEVKVKMHQNKSEKVHHILARNMVHAKYRAKKISRNAAGQYPRVISVKRLS